ncbi:hypothetical protein BGX33_009631, partial [Mortierella sp. NVP41]
MSSTSATLVPASATTSQTVMTTTIQKPSAVLGFIAGGMAACGAVTITNPAE